MACIILCQNYINALFKYIIVSIVTIYTETCLADTPIALMNFKCEIIVILKLSVKRCLFCFVRRSLQCHGALKSFFHDKWFLIHIQNVKTKNMRNTVFKNHFISWRKCVTQHLYNECEKAKSLKCYNWWCLPECLEISLFISVEEFWPALLCRIAFIKPHWWAFKHELPVQGPATASQLSSSQDFD